MRINREGYGYVTRYTTALFAEDLRAKYGDPFDTNEDTHNWAVKDIYRLNCRILFQTLSGARK